MLEFKDFGLDYENVDKKSYKILEKVNINFEKRLCECNNWGVRLW